MKKKYRWLLIGALLIGLALLFVVLSTVRVGRRVKSIDLGQIYTNIQDFSEGREGFVIRAGEYPSMVGIAYYHFKTSRGSISLACCSDDFNSWINSRHHWEIGPTSQSIGEEAFFKNETQSEGTLELAYRRHNLGVCFRNHPKREYRGGRPVFTTAADKKELEHAAKILDDAILQSSPAIKIEDVWLYQVVGHKVEFLRHPVISLPMLFELALGCAVGARSKRAIWRFLAWPIIPLLVALTIVTPMGLFSQSGVSRGWAVLAFVYLFPTGLAACGTGILVGYLLRRKRMSTPFA